MNSERACSYARQKGVNERRECQYPISNKEYPIMKEERKKKHLTFKNFPFNHGNRWGFDEKHQVTKKIRNDSDALYLDVGYSLLDIGYSKW